MIIKKLTIPIAFILGLSIGLASVSFATDTHPVEAVLSKAKLSLNGQNLPVERPILIYDGSAYVPTEALVRLGYTVNWSEMYGILDLQKPVTYIVGEDGQPVPVDDELLRKILESLEVTTTPGLDE